MIKFLCVCEGGNCRSVALAQQLKERGHDAVAVGWRYNSPEVIVMLALWADTVVFLQDFPNPYGIWILEEHRQKVRILDVGPDRWYVAQHPELNDIIRAKLSEIL